MKLDDSIFIVGAQGQLGTALRQQYPNSRHADVDELDITDKKSVEEFDWSNIKVIVNAAAYTNVDGAETPEGRVAAWKVNADAVANLVAVAAQKDITLVHISTEYVFDGTNELHKEDEPLSPLSSYGASKAAADIVVSMLPKHYILRTSWVIGEGKNFVRTMLGLGQKGISPSVVNDQIGRLTFTSELVRAIHHLLSNEEKISYGTYNLTNSGEAVSWANVTRAVFSLAGYDELTVTNTTTAEYFKDKPEAAVRPLNSTLDLSLIEGTGFTPKDWKDNLKEYIEKEKEA
jgi:dTDP-4-dehydrorhamnose 3,5-epimerase/reductase